MAKQGGLKVQCFVNDSYVPIDKIRATLTPADGQGGEGRTIDLTTNSSGESQVIALEAPPLEYSQQPIGKIPYSLYDLRIEREGFQSLVVMEFRYSQHR